jgi:hypothetical protein
LKHQSRKRFASLLFRLLALHLAKLRRGCPMRVLH